MDKCICNGYVYSEVIKVIYGPPQAGHIKHNHLVEILEMFEYAPMEVTSRLYQHKVRPIGFMLLVGNFGVNHTRKKLEHLIAKLRTK